MKIKLILALILCSLIVANDIISQASDNKPFQDLIDASMVKTMFTYDVYDFICSDSTRTRYDFDSLGRVVLKQRITKYNASYNSSEYIENSFTERIESAIHVNIKTRSKDSTDLTSIFFDNYIYDEYDRITEFKKNTVSGILVEHKIYDYDDENRLVKVIHRHVPKRFRRSRPNGSIDTFLYNKDYTEIFQYRVKENGTLSKYPKCRDIKKEELEPKKGQDILEISEIDDNSVPKRKVFKFDEKGNWFSLESYKTRDGVEKKIYSRYRTIIYREN